MPEVILVAGRGPMAARAIRSCRSAGAKVVAVYSEVDADAVHVRLADESVLIGQPPPESSYLDTRAIVEAAQVSGADAILPVPAILAGSLDLARATEAAGLLWIGADPAALTAVEAAGLGSAQIAGAADGHDFPGWVIGLADDFRIDGLVVGRTRTAGASLCWSSAEEPADPAVDGLPPSAGLLAALSDRVVELGWRGLVTVAFGPDGSARGVRGGVPAELALVELRAGRDLVQAAIAAAEGTPPPPGSPGHPAAVGGSIRATAVPGPGQQARITEFTGPAAEGDLRWEPGCFVDDSLWPAYDPVLATIAVPGANLAGAIGAYLAATSSISIAGVPSDLGRLRSLAGEVAARIPGDPE